MRRVIPGNHLTMLDAASADDACVQIILQTLTRGAAPAGPRSAARLAVEEGKFQKVIETLWPDPQGTRRYRGWFRWPLRSMRSVGAQDAIADLEGYRGRGTDALGVLGGRYKRRWLLERRRADAEKALRPVSPRIRTVDRQDAAGSRAGLLSRHQSRLHGARLWRRLPRGKRAGDARSSSIAGSRENPREKFWRIATEADAQLILGHTDEGIAKHAEAARLPMQPWQALSIQEQAHAHRGPFRLLAGADRSDRRPL